MGEAARENGWDGFRSFGKRVEGHGWEFTCDGMPTMMGCGAQVYVTRRWSKVGSKSSGWLVTHGMEPKPQYGESASMDEPEKWQTDFDVVLAYCPSCRVVVEEQEAEWKARLKARVATLRAERPDTKRKRGDEVTRSECPVCHEQVPVTPGGALRKHPKGATPGCPGAPSFAERRTSAPRKARKAPQPPPAAAEEAPAPAPPEPYVPPAPVRVVPGVYRSGEEMLDIGLRPPPGHGVLTIHAHVPIGEGRTGPEEAALLFEDPGYLSTVLDKVPNDLIRITLRVG